MNSDMNERDLEKLSKVEFIKLVQKLQKKAKKPKIGIVDNDHRQASSPIAQPQKSPRRIPPRDPKTGQVNLITPVQLQKDPKMQQPIGELKPVRRPPQRPPPLPPQQPKYRSIESLSNRTRS